MIPSRQRAGTCGANWPVPAVSWQPTATMGTSLACYLRNHSIVVATATIEKAMPAAINLEQTNQVPLLAFASGDSFQWTADEESLRKRARNHAPQALQHVWNYYSRRVSQL